MELSTLQFVLALLVGILVGFSKTGIPSIGILSVTSMALIFEAKASVGILLPMLIIGDLFAVTYYRRKVVWKHLWGLIPWVLSGIVIGYFILDWSDNRLLQVLIGSIVLLLLIVHLVKEHLDKRVERMIDKARWFSPLLGILAGFTTMIGNAAGGIMSIYLLSKRLNKTEFIGTGAWFFLFVNLVKVPFYLQLGLINKETILFNSWMVPAIITGAVIGIFILKRIPQTWFQRIIVVLTAIGAIRLIIG